MHVGKICSVVAKRVKKPRMNLVYIELCKDPLLLGCMSFTLLGNNQGLRNPLNKKDLKTFLELLILLLM